MHISMLRWCIIKATRTINAVKKQKRIQIRIFMLKYLSFVYHVYYSPVAALICALGT